MSKDGKRKGAWKKAALTMLAASLILTSVPARVMAEEERPVLQTVEAEDGTLLGQAKISPTGASVSGLEHAGDGVEVTIHVQEAGLYDVIVRSSVKGSGTKINDLNVNGQHVGDITTSTGNWSEQTVPHVWLEEGDNTISITTSYGWIVIDSFSIRKAAPLPDDVYDVEPTLVNPNATESAKRLMTYLCDQYGKTVLSGQQCQEGAYGIDNAAIWRGTGGSYAAVVGMDLLSYSPARVAKGDHSNVVELAIEAWHPSGETALPSIVTLCWHWCPDARYDKNDLWSTFYADKTKFDLAKAMNGADPDGYQMLLDDIDAIAVQLKRLQDADVPVLWRPLHEASGGWFWWGASGADAYLKLYKLMYDRLTNVHGLNNLIWVWNGQDAAWYPGDEYVDIIGEDIYPGEHQYTSQAARFIKALGYTDTRKIITLSENGCIPDPEQLQRDNIMWSYWCTWCGDFVLKTAGFNQYGETYTEKSMLKKAYKSDVVITRKELPDLRNYPLREESAQ